MESKLFNYLLNRSLSFFKWLGVVAFFTFSITVVTEFIFYIGKQIIHKEVFYYAIEYQITVFVVGLVTLLLTTFVLWLVTDLIGIIYERIQDDYRNFDDRKSKKD